MNDFRLRIGMYTPSYPGLTGAGGIGTYTRLQALELTRLGHEVHVLVPGKQPDTHEGDVQIHFVSEDHFPLIDRFQPGFGRLWRIDRRARELVRRHALHLFEFPNWDGIGSRFGQKRPVPFVVRLNTSAQESQIIDAIPLSLALQKDIQREHQQASLADRLVTNSHAHAKNMAQELGIEEGRIQVVPIGIEVFPEYDREDRAGKTEDEEKESLIVYVGRMEKRKGTVDLLRAFPAVLNAIPDARLVMIGADRPHCPGGRFHHQFLADEFPQSVRERVTFPGRLSDEEMDRWMQRAMVFVAPSLYESFGIIFLEAMRWGTPVIGTQAGGIPEIVTHEASGILTAPEDPDALAIALTRLLGDTELRQRLGRAGKSRAETCFPIQKMTADMVQIYREILEAAR
jgi:glycosyltransferase involved in cell wall biosynthesis